MLHSAGRAESEGRLEQWYDYLSLQEQYALQDSYKKVVAQVGLNFSQSPCRLLCPITTVEFADRPANALARDSGSQMCRIVSSMACVFIE